jgi:hypothetical protein
VFHGRVLQPTFCLCKIFVDLVPDAAYKRAIMKKRLLLLSALLAIGTTELFLATPKVDAQARAFPNWSGNTATSTAAAATINKYSGVITTEALATAAGANYTFTLTNSEIRSAYAIIYIWGAGGSNTAGVLGVVNVVSSSGSAVITFRNAGPAALNGTVVFGFLILSP